MISKPITLRNFFLDRRFFPFSRFFCHGVDLRLGTIGVKSGESVLGGPPTPLRVVRKVVLEIAREKAVVSSLFLTSSPFLHTKRGAVKEWVGPFARRRVHSVFDFGKVFFSKIFFANVVLGFVAPGQHTWFQLIWGSCRLTGNGSIYQCEPLCLISDTNMPGVTIYVVFPFRLVCIFMDLGSLEPFMFFLSTIYRSKIYCDKRSKHVKECSTCTNKLSISI